MKRFLKLSVVVVVMGLLALATTAPVYAKGPAGPDQHVSPTGHFASCSAQHTVIHNAEGGPIGDADVWFALHAKIHSECDNVL